MTQCRYLKENLNKLPKTQTQNDPLLYWKALSRLIDVSEPELNSRARRLAPRLGPDQDASLSRSRFFSRKCPPFGGYNSPVGSRPLPGCLVLGTAVSLSRFWCEPFWGLSWTWTCTFHPVLIVHAFVCPVSLRMGCYTPNTGFLRLTCLI